MPLLALFLFLPLLTVFLKGLTADIVINMSLSIRDLLPSSFGLPHPFLRLWTLLSHDSSLMSLGIQ